MILEPHQIRSKIVYVQGTINLCLTTFWYLRTSFLHIDTEIQLFFMINYRIVFRYSNYTNDEIMKYITLINKELVN